VNKEEALVQIDLISKVIKASNHVLMSGSRMIGFGFLMLLVPFIEYLTHGLSFNIALLGNLYISLVIHVLFFTNQLTHMRAHMSIR